MIVDHKVRILIFYGGGKLRNGFDGANSSHVFDAKDYLVNTTAKVDDLINHLEVVFCVKPRGKGVGDGWLKEPSPVS